MNRHSDTASTILVVDDDPDSREWVAEVLHEEGFVVHTAADGFQGLTKANTFEPDLLLTDFEMPGMNGMELIERTRSGRHAVVQQAILMTGWDGETMEIEARRHGAAEVLAKPLDPDRLVTVVRRTLTTSDGHGVR